LQRGMPRLRTRKFRLRYALNCGSSCKAPHLQDQALRRSAAAKRSFSYRSRETPVTAKTSGPTNQLRIAGRRRMQASAAPSRLTSPGPNLICQPAVVDLSSMTSGPPRRNHGTRSCSAMRPLGLSRNAFRARCGLRSHISGDGLVSFLMSGHTALVSGKACVRLRPSGLSGDGLNMRLCLENVDKLCLVAGEPLQCRKLRTKSEI
jgi:hypothetical protein